MSKCQACGLVVDYSHSLEKGLCAGCREKGDLERGKVSLARLQAGDVPPSAAIINGTGIVIAGTLCMAALISAYHLAAVENEYYWFLLYGPVVALLFLYLRRDHESSNDS